MAFLLLHNYTDFILYFDDIRAEEWTPSYAGKCARVDFLLKNEKIVIEVKKTRKCKLCLNGMPVPLLRNCYSIFNGTKYR